MVRHFLGLFGAIEKYIDNFQKIWTKSFSEKNLALFGNVRFCNVWLTAIFEEKIIWKNSCNRSGRAGKVQSESASNFKIGLKLKELWQIFEKMGKKKFWRRLNFKIF